MEEKYFEERNEKFYESLQDNNQNKIEQKISLRKIKKSETLMSKRAKLLNDKKISIYEPKIDKKELSKKVLDLFEEEKSSKIEDLEIIISKYFNILENSNHKNYSDSYFILDRLLCIISSLNEEYLYKIFDYLSLGHKLFDIFENYTYVNKIHIFQTFKILVNISMRKNKDLMSKLINLTSVKYISNFLYEFLNDINNNCELICQIILFLMNLIEDNPYIQFIYYRYQIFELLYEFVLENKDSDDNQIRNINHHIITFFSLFVAVQFDENEEIFLTDKEKILVNLYNLFEYFLIQNYGNKDLLLDVVWGFSNILMQLNEKDEYIDSIADNYFNNILPNLQILIKMDSDFVIPIFRIIGNITSLKDIYCERFFDDFWGNYLLKLLEDTILPKHKILIIWILHNICAGTNFKCINKYDMDKILLNAMINEKNELVLFHILKLNFGIINNSKSSFINNELIDALITLIKKDISERINLVCCLFSEKIFEEKNDKFINKLNEIGFKEILDNWSISNNEELKNSAAYILENYYKNGNS